ncbi:Oligopeptide transport ATP-binding protein OppD [Aquimixticola soesokkakensis]|uniref:Oligopeptide transport ATP-binding protein OppD n=1 Tax=Aquimixticola soesokkakensis TaxID=1519096 RepID=A0A1Y5TJ44_9RHOB|nr:ABC transporter ATP-binding protein [Aquimixticola soesokkakensis]SLN63167.1 Oligopeptide transport ATP-binding protein OppD [Aquimixticola soesokkakensis]
MPLDPQSEVVLEVRNLTTTISIRTDEFAAVDNVSLSLKRGETLGLVGESGSGKSLTGLSLLNLVPKHAARVAGGAVMLDGVDLLQLSEREMRRVRGKKISMILQDPQTSLNPSFSVGSQIGEALSLHTDVPKKGLKAAAVEMLRRVRVAAPEHRVDAYPHQMSGGMRQRVVGAIAISCAPDVIIADEPTTSLDVTVQAQYIRLLQELQAETGMGIIFITHDFGIVAKVCHRLAVMYAGQIVETGPVERIFDAPGHPYTQALLGSVPKLHGQQGRLPSISGNPPALWNKPKGCKFAPRCPLADTRCHTEEPPVYDTPDQDGREHWARCWRLETQ